MKTSEIQRAVAARVESVSGLVPVIHDRKGDGSEITGREAYAHLKITPLDNRERVYGSGVLRSGYIVVNVHAPNGYGATPATEEAERFADLFPEGLQFDGVTIPDEPNIREPADSSRDGWFYIHTSIYFEAQQ